jgi:diguanylate cyclase (GGDEF)-like protein/PAS domain S-box-containing protein
MSIVIGARDERGGAQEASLRQLVRVEQYDMAMRLSPLMICVIFPALQFLIWLFWEPERWAFFVRLDASAVILTVITVHHWLRWRAAPRPPVISNARLYAACLVAVLSGAALASMLPELYFSADASHRLLLAVSFTGLMGTSMALAVMPALSVSFAAPIVLTAFVEHASAGEPVSTYLATLIVFYAIFLWVLTYLLGGQIEKRVIAQADLEREQINLKREQALTALLLNDFEQNSKDWLWDTDRDLRLDYVSDRLVEITGLTQDELRNVSLAATLAAMRPGATRAAYENLLHAMEARKAFFELLLPVKVFGARRWWLLSGKPIIVDGHFSGYRGVGSDVTEKKLAEDRLSYLVTHDALTDLPNRLAFQNQLDLLLARLSAREPFAALCLDLDEFKSVNDTLGHAAGDAVLKIASRRIRKILPDKAFLARIAGDEFVILLAGVAGANKASVCALCEKIVTVVNEPCPVGDGVTNVGISIGVAFAPQDGAHDIMRRADLALYQAKRSGRNSHRYYVAEMDDERNARLALIADLQNALDRREFELYFQPLVNAATCRILGFEALLRWRHATRGFVPPTEFIPLAEESGLIVPLGQWIIGEACREAATWPEHIKIAVNISSVQFRYSELPNVVAGALRANGLAAHRLELELTESVFLEATASTQKSLNDLHDLGVQLALDDFGTGFSSLSYLRRFSFNKIKIDQSFVCNLPHDRRDVAIVRAVVDIATSMGVATIAEGVETEEQRMCLLEQGCHQLQGYLFSKPVCGEEVMALLATDCSEPRRMRA